MYDVSNARVIELEKLVAAYKKDLEEQLMRSEMQKI